MTMMMRSRRLSLAYLVSQDSLVLRIQLSLALHIFSLAVQGSASIYLLEQSVCRQQLPGSPGLPFFRDEKGCKTPEIEAQVAEVDGVLTFIRSLAIFAGTIFYTFYVDRLGLRWVVLAGALSILVESLYLTLGWFTPSFPPTFVWWAPIFNLVGGGSETFVVLHYALLTKHSSQRGLANNIFRLDLICTLASFVASAVTSLMLRSSIGTLYLFVLGCLTLVSLIAFSLLKTDRDGGYSAIVMLKEVDQNRVDIRNEDADQDPLQTSTSPPNNGNIVDPSDIDLPAPLNRFVLWGSIGTLCIVSLAYSSDRLLGQWPSAMLDWSLSWVAALDAYHVAVNSVVLYALPYVRAWLTPRLFGKSEQYPYNVDRLVIIVSLLGAAIGSFGMGTFRSNILFMFAVSMYDLSCVHIYTLRAILNVCAKKLQASESKVNIIFVAIFSTGSLLSTPVYLRMASWAFGGQTNYPGLVFQVPAVIYVLASAAVYGVFWYVSTQYRNSSPLLSGHDEDSEPGVHEQDVPSPTALPSPVASE